MGERDDGQSPWLCFDLFVHALRAYYRPQSAQFLFNLSTAEFEEILGENCSLGVMIEAMCVAQRKLGHCLCGTHLRLGHVARYGLSLSGGVFRDKGGVRGSKRIRNRNKPVSS